MIAELKKVFVLHLDNSFDKIRLILKRYVRDSIWQTMDMECSDPHHAQVNAEKLRKIKRLLEDPQITKEQIVEAIIKHPMIYDLRVGCLGSSMQNDARDIPISITSSPCHPQQSEG